MKLTRKLLALLLALMMVLSAAAFAEGAAVEQTLYLTFPSSNNANTYDFLYPWDNETLPNNLLWLTLIQADKDLNAAQPEIMETWDISEDGTVITMTLKDGLLWSDGTPITMDDVVWTFERYCDGKGNYWSFVVAAMKYIKGYDAFHAGDDGFFQRRNLFGYRVEDQFVVDLKHHAALQPEGIDFLLDADHRQFDDVGRRPLDGGVHGVPLGERAQGGVPRVDVRQVAPPAENGLHVAGLAGGGFRVFYVGADGRERGEVVFDELLCFPPSDAQALGEAEGGYAVQDAEIGGLGDPALLGGDLFMRDAEDLRCRGAVDVDAGAEGFDQMGVAAQVGHDPQFDLGVVR